MSPRAIAILAALAIGGAGLVLAFNFAVPSLLNFYWRFPDPARWEQFLRYIIRLHAETVGPFTRRPVTTALLHQVYLRTHDAWLAFLLLQGALLAASAFTLGLVTAGEDGPRSAWLAPCLYLASFTVLFSFVTPNDAFDEPAQYLFFFLALYFLRRQEGLGFGCAYFLACLSRETSVLLIPGLWLLDRQGFSAKRRLVKFALPLVGWAAFYFWKDAAGDPGRFLYWAKNFGSVKLGFETILSLALAVAAPAALYFKAHSQAGANKDPWARSFLLALALNTPIVFFAAYARESRLLALPLLFLWPKLSGAASRLKRLSMGSACIVAALGALGAALIFSSYAPAYRHVLGYQIYAALLPGALLFIAMSRIAADEPSASV